MKFVPRLALASLFFLTACAGDKYPYQPQFVGPDAIAITALGAPPKKGSAQWESEIKSIEKRQAALTETQKAALHNEDHITPGMLVLPVLGANYTEEHYPALYTLLRHAASDAWRIGDAHQDYWQSPRPWVADTRVQLLVPSITRPGYPSGHTTTNTVWAYILSDLFPAKRKALFARAYEIGYHRIDGGAHFPHDVEAGKRLAGMIYGNIRKTDDYAIALEDAREEVAENSEPGNHGHTATTKVTSVAVH
jgi:acid phosphatase (class A)